MKVDKGICESIKKNVDIIKKYYGCEEDIEITYFTIRGENELPCVSIYFKDLVDKKAINNISLKITNAKNEISKNKVKVKGETIKEFIVGFSWRKEGNSFDDLYSELLLGNCVFLAEGDNKFYSIYTSRIERRSIEEPATQTVVRGPREGFSEDIGKNILLIKKRINNNSLRMISLKVGKVYKTKVAIMYIDGIAKNDIVNEVKKRIAKIKVDAIHDSSYIEELTKDDPYSVFPTFLSLEKSDSVSSALLQGKLAILVDGTPFVLTVPAVFLIFCKVVKIIIITI